MIDTIRDILSNFICQIVGHKFRYESDHTKRFCVRCNREDWVVTRPYTRVGEVKHYWGNMNIPQRGRR